MLMISFSSYGLTISRSSIGSTTGSFSVDTSLSSDFEFQVSHNGAINDLDFGQISIVPGVCAYLSNFTCVDDGVNKEITIIVPLSMVAKISGNRSLTSHFSFMDTIGKEFDNRSIKYLGVSTSGVTFNHDDTFNFEIEIKVPYFSNISKESYESIFNVGFTVMDL